ncbi:MAG: hypothetical protein RR618_00510 [Cellulosilyticaceae bacterium]
MLKYIRFIFWLFYRRFVFFKYPVRRQASVLEKKKLYLEAGIKYYRIKNYDKALHCFKTCAAHRQLIKTYEKLGLISEALQIADHHKYYKEGALLSEKIGNYLKAAYFYSYFNPLHAAKLYKKECHFFEAGLCYLQKFQFVYAIDCFYKCPNPLHRAHGFRQVEDIATVLYFQKSYADSFKLFLRIKDYRSALECAKKLEDPTLIQNTAALLNTQQTYACNQANNFTPLIQIKVPSYASLSENLKQLSA